MYISRVKAEPKHETAFLMCAHGVGAPTRSSGGANSATTQMEDMVKMTSEQAIKMYLLSKDDLSAADLTTFSENDKPQRGKHGVMKKARTEPVSCFFQRSSSSCIEYMAHASGHASIWLPQGGQSDRPTHRPQSLSRKVHVEASSVILGSTRVHAQDPDIQIKIRPNGSRSSRFRLSAIPRVVGRSTRAAAEQFRRAFKRDSRILMQSLLFPVPRSIFHYTNKSLSVRKPSPHPSG